MKQVIYMTREEATQTFDGLIRTYLTMMRGEETEPITLGKNTLEFHLVDESTQDLVEKMNQAVEVSSPIDDFEKHEVKLFKFRDEETDLWSVALVERYDLKLFTYKYRILFLQNVGDVELNHGVVMSMAKDSDDGWNQRRVDEINNLCIDAVMELMEDRKEYQEQYTPMDDIDMPLTPEEKMDGVIEEHFSLHRGTYKTNPVLIICKHVISEGEENLVPFMWKTLHAHGPDFNASEARAIAVRNEPEQEFKVTEKTAHDIFMVNYNSLSTNENDDCYMVYQIQVDNDPITILIRRVGGRCSVMRKSCDHNIDNTDLLYLIYDAPHCEEFRTVDYAEANAAYVSVRDNYKTTNEYEKALDLEYAVYHFEDAVLGDTFVCCQTVKGKPVNVIDNAVFDDKYLSCPEKLLAQPIMVVLKTRYHGNRIYRSEDRKGTIAFFNKVVQMTKDRRELKKDLKEEKRHYVITEKELIINRIQSVCMLLTETESGRIMASLNLRTDRPLTKTQIEEMSDGARELGVAFNETDAMDEYYRWVRITKAYYILKRRRIKVPHDAETKIRQLIELCPWLLHDAKHRAYYTEVLACIIDDMPHEINTKLSEDDHYAVYNPIVGNAEMAFIVRENTIDQPVQFRECKWHTDDIADAPLLHILQHYYSASINRFVTTSKEEAEEKFNEIVSGWDDHDPADDIC